MIQKSYTFIREGINKYIERVFYIDLRSLALFRILLGAIIILDIILRSRYLEAFYSDTGVFPRWVVIKEYSNSLNFSIHHLGGGVYFQGFLFCLNLVSAFFLTIGYRTRFFTIICWIFCVSIQNRNGLLLNSGDSVTRFLLLWGIFLPLGAKYSVDKAMDLISPDEIKVSNICSMALLLQVLMIYFFTGLLKNDPIWFPKGTALQYVLNLDMMVRPFATYLLKFPNLLKILTFKTYFWELLMPIIMLIPFYVNQLRIIAIISAYLFHIGIFIFMSIGLFPLICMVVWILFIPTAFWDLMFKRYNHLFGNNLYLYFDENCKFCKRMVYLIKTFLALPYLEIKPAQSIEKIKLIMDTEKSWILKNKENQIFLGYDAFLVLIKNSIFSKLFFSLLSSRIATFLGSRCYDLIRKKRDILGLLTGGLIWKEIVGYPKIFGKMIVGFLLIYIILINLRTLPYKSVKNIVGRQSYFKWLRPLLRVDQRWSMFSPFPTKSDGWFVIEGKNFKGEKINLWSDARESFFEKPKTVSKTYKSSRWRKYLKRIWLKKNKKYRVYFGKYLCRKYNRGRKNKDRLKNFNIHFMLEKTNLTSSKNAVKRTFWRHNCFKKSKKTFGFLGKKGFKPKKVEKIGKKETNLFSRPKKNKKKD